MLMSIGSLLIMVGPNTHMVDLDIGKCFITFDFYRYWQNITESIWYIIWGRRRRPSRKNSTDALGTNHDGSGVSPLLLYSGPVVCK